MNLNITESLPNSHKLIKLDNIKKQCYNVHEINTNTKYMFKILNKQKILVFSVLVLLLNIINFIPNTYAQYSATGIDTSTFPSGPTISVINNINKNSGESVVLATALAGFDQIEVQFTETVINGSIRYELTPTTQFGPYPSGQGILSLKITTENINRSAHKIIFRFRINRAFSNVKGFVINSPVSEIPVRLLSSDNTYNTFEANFNGIPQFFGVSGQQETIRTGSEDSLKLVTVIILISLSYILIELSQPSKQIIRR